MASDAVNHKERHRKKKEKKKKTRNGFWNCTATVSIKAVFTIFLLGTALFSKNNLKRKNVLVERGNSSCQMVVKGNPNSC